MEPSAGLSPHVRGNPVQLRPPRLQAGSIPARAGEPSPVRSVVVVAWGLSPHVRGNP